MPIGLATMPVMGDGSRLRRPGLRCVRSLREPFGPVPRFGDRHVLRTRRYSLSLVLPWHPWVSVEP